MVRESERESDSFIRDLLDLYYSVFKMNSSLKLTGDRAVYSSRYWTSFLSQISSSYPDLYNNMILEDGLHLSPIGLWCLNMPVTINQEKIGIITTGYVLIKGKEAESESILEKSLKTHEDSLSNIRYFLNLLRSVDAVDEANFDERYLRDLCLVDKYIKTNMQRVAKEEERINNLKNLSQSLAHQFLLPIQSILANSENIMVEYDDLNASCKTTEMIEMIHDIFLDVQKLALSADNLRNWTAFEHDINRYEFSRSSILPIIIDSIKLFRKESRFRGININSPQILGGPVPLLKISPDHMRRVFYNLMSNAVKYSFDSISTNKRFIDITCRYAGNRYVIEISNYGVGILPEEIESGKIFQIGYRGKLARDRNRFGSGLGLPTVKKVVEDHGGDIAVRSIPTGSSQESNFQPYLNTVKISLPLDNNLQMEA